MSWLANIYGWVMQFGPAPVVAGGLLGSFVGGYLSSGCHKLCDSATGLALAQCVSVGWVEKQGLLHCPEPILYGFLGLLLGFGLYLVTRVQERSKQR
jgi:hypothetical protein